MRYTAQIGPFPLVLRLVGLDPDGQTAPLQYAAQLYAGYETVLEPRHLGGFPVLLDTQQTVHAEALRLTSGPIPVRSGGEAVAYLFGPLASFCPPALAGWGGAYALRRLDLTLIERTALGDRPNVYSAEASDSDLVPLPSARGAFGDRDSAAWLRARQASHAPLPAYAVSYERVSAPDRHLVTVRIADAAAGEVASDLGPNDPPLRRVPADPPLYGDEGGAGR
jgi:hypothetical protein